MSNQVLHQAIAAMGSQTALAKAIGKTQGHISKWLERDHVPAQSVLAIEGATGIPRQMIRPDLYPENPQLPDPTPRKSIMGCLKGMIVLPDDFDPTAPAFDESDWSDELLSQDRHGYSVE